MRATARRPDLEPIVAFGARMSWNGLLRSGDRFCPSERSQRVVLTARSGPPVRRNYGAWSARYRRFTANLSTPRITVRAASGDLPGDGVEAILHWVRRADALGTGPGTVCAGDGWPVELWHRFAASGDRLAAGGVAERLDEYAASSLDGNEPLVRAWRAWVGSEPGTASAPAESAGGWLPVPAALELPEGPSRCLLSWSPTPHRFASVGEALASVSATSLDLERQAEYHVECALATLHGVRFGPHDALSDPEYERTPLVAGLLRTGRRREEEAIADPSLGRLDRRT
jgi:hypothetical protein